MQNISPSQVSAEVPINENFALLAHQEVYGKNAATTTGLTLGYNGGVWGGFTVAAGTLALANSASNYIVALRSTGAISSSTATTNWLDTLLYARVYLATTSGGVITVLANHRVGEFGALGFPRTIKEGTPATAASAGVKGTVLFDAGFVYICTATNTWVRAALSTW
jgi:hypothetical protein